MSKIPKIYHWIWLNFKDETNLDTPIPNKYRQIVEETKSLNPDWTFVEWNGRMIRNLLETEYPWFLPTFNAYKKPIQRADAARYFILYTYGGIYTDLDSICKKPLTPLLEKYEEYDCVIAKEQSSLRRKPTNAIMLAKHGSDFMKYLMSSLEEARNKNWYKTGMDYVFYTTGPDFIIDSLRSYKGSDNIGYLIEEVVNTKNPNMSLFQYEYFVNMNEGTWKYDEYLSYMRLGIVAFILLIIGFVYYKRRK